MKTTAIIAEYNPFHNGHQYHLTQSRIRTDADYLIVVMSGDFVQRGAPALCNKYLRTRMALACGADLVLELPTIYATASAEHFSSGSISLLNSLHVVDTLSFGSECGDLQALWNCAQTICVLEKQPEFQHLLRDYQRNGCSYPAAIQKAICTCTENTADLSMIASPNNILGLEYCKALLRSGSCITPSTLLRAGEGYHSLNTSPTDGCFVSASALRILFKENNCDLQQLLTEDRFLSQVPKEVLSIISSRPDYRFGLSENDCSVLLYYQLLTQSVNGFDVFDGCSTEFSSKIRKYLPNYQTFTGFCEQLKSKDLTFTGISRILTRILLGIRTEEITPFAAQDTVPYARLLGFRKCAAPLLNRIKKESSIPLIAKPADASRLLSKDAFRIFERDIEAAQIYEALSSAKNGTQIQNEYQQSPIVWDHY